MRSNINLKAKIDRHSRILKENLGNKNNFRSFYHKINYNIVFLFVVFLFPIYPLFSSFFYENTTYDFYRGDIDESSIIDSYTNTDDNSIIVSNDSFISINTLMDGDRDVSGYNEVIKYEVKPGDSVALIAQNFSVTTNSILWANNFDSKKILHPGEIIKIPPVSGLIHKVTSGETISSLAKKYKVDEDKIIAQNNLSGASSSINIGQELIIPGAIKDIPKPVIVANKPIVKNNNTKNNNNKQYSFTSGGNSEFINTNGTYKLVKRTPQWTFYWGNCTWFVAQYKNVDWSGNAKDWLANARNKGHETGSTPGVGSIVVFHGKGYNPIYGHVGIVIDITSTDIIVKDMNYRRLNEVTTRKVPKNDRAIKGYIYVD
ncbi:LysM peptidoglycan-binding domain-containing protein [Candidatus Gracilibacteria bacterium]|nr:LysM peptidoglycan-binding domain-containing protein [Candidatus Gracilibacteria bacterium]